MSQWEPNEGGKKAERRLLEQFRKLPEADRKTLQDLAEFLRQRNRGHENQAPLPEPDLIPRPAEESVVKAIKRLSASYHMLDRSPMLNETSALMAQHILHGRKASDVIDALEMLFAERYEMARRERAASE